VESSPTVAAFTAAPKFRSVSAGWDHTCGISSFTRAYCWGYNSTGQLGTFDRMKRLTATPVKGQLPLDTVVAGNANSCGLTTHRVTYCWGQNLPTGTTTQPSLLDSTRHFVQIAAELNHMCGLTQAGQAWCRGANGSGQLGDGTRTDRPALVKVLGGHTFRQISTSTYHTCAVTTDDRAFCWGDNGFGQVGNGGTSFTPVATPTAVLGGVRFQAVSAGGTFTCGLATDDRAYCWGWNNEGQLGDETLTDEPKPTLVHGGHRWLGIEAGEDHVCAVDLVGKGFCWGRGGEGQLGIGVLDVIDHGQKPRAVVGGLIWRQISAGGLHSCGVTTADVVYCWGYNLRGQLGDGTVTTRPKPTKVVSPS
jgi:alpha-tubulin suppressor-like RCC1 family protein